MKSLIRMLFNVALNTWHPIFYLEAPFPGPPSENSVTRFKSKFHYTAGFASREDAVKSIHEELTPKVKEHFSLYSDLRIDIDQDIPWDGEGIPTDITLEPSEKHEAVSKG